LITDARNSSQVAARIETHTLILGGGTVGLFLGVLLSRSKIPVLVIESGGRVPQTDRNNEIGTSIGKVHSGVQLGRTFGLGGTSTLWGGQLAEFDSSDLTMPGREWPITHTELTQLYQSVYEMFDMAPLPVQEYRALFGGETIEDECIERFFTHWLRQPNFAALFKSDISANTNLSIILNLTATEVLFDSYTARSVVALSSDGRKVEIAAKNIVAACGTIENSRFFLSTQRQERIPWSRNNNIGCYFQDHLGGKVASVEIHNEQKLREYFENCFAHSHKLQPKLRLTNKGRMRTGIGMSGALSFDSELTSSFQNLKSLVKAVRSGVSYSTYQSLPSDLRRLGFALFPIMLRYLRDRRVLAFYDKSIEFYVQAEQKPLPDSRIRLESQERQRDGLFKALLDWRISGDEIAAIREFSMLADGYLDRRGIGRLRIFDEILNNDLSALNRLEDTYHQCGGLCMSVSPSLGVVDTDCRVWNTRNVFVAGASVFPTSSHANCTLTALALTFRLASKLSNTK
jgi:choline dehydrogenase-like flavoprotein